MALDGNEDHDDQARSKAMLETAFQSDAFERVPKRVPNLKQRMIVIIPNIIYIYIILNSICNIITPLKVVNIL